MKVVNDFGSRFSGTVGKQITASTWKGRNYIKKFTKPSNPNTANQQTVRGYFAAAVALWKTLATAQKNAYANKTRADKTNISPFNTMISSYTKIKNAGLVYTSPRAGGYEILEDGTENPIEGALITVKKTGQTTVYQTAVSDALGIMQAGICVEDENYDFVISATGYDSYIQSDKTAAETWSGLVTIHLAPIV